MNMKANRKLEFKDSQAEMIDHVMKKHRRIKRRQKTVGVLALIVIVVSGYALMRPAITMDQESFCGQGIEAAEEAAQGTPEQGTAAEAVPENPESREASAPAESAAAKEAGISIPAHTDAPDVSAADAKAEDFAAKGAPADQSLYLDTLTPRPAEAADGDEITLTVGFGWTNRQSVNAGDYIIVTWPETGTARLELTACPAEVHLRNSDTVIATTAWEQGKLTITFSEEAEDITGILKRWGRFDMKFMARIDQEHPGSSAALTISGGALSGTVTVSKGDEGGTGGEYYTIYDASGGNYRKVLDPDGNLDAQWSLCLNHNKPSPGTSTTANGEYLKIVNPTEEQYMEFAGDDTPGRYQRVRRILYAKAELYPDYNYYVFQDELYYAITGMAKYDTTWGDAELDRQKTDIRAAADSTQYDADIEDRLTVVIYQERKGRYQNTITATVTPAPAPPPPADTASLTVAKQVGGEGGEQDRDFHFTLHLYEPRQPGTTNVAPLTGTYRAERNGVAETITFDSEGRADFTLRHGESLKIIGIIKGFYYKIAEGEDGGYTTTVERTDAASQYDPAGDFNNFDSCEGVTDEAGITFINTKIPSAKLTFKKLVTGEGGDTNKEFIFYIHLESSADGTPLAGERAVYRNGSEETLVFDADGYAQVTLKHGDVLEIRGLPVIAQDGILRGVIYEIAEDDYEGDGYTTQINITGQDPLDWKEDKGTANNANNERGLLGDAQVTFTNNKDSYDYVLPETGGTGIGGYTKGGTALVFAALLSLLIIKHVHRKEGCP